MLVFFVKYCSIFSYLSNILLSLIQIRKKCAINEVPDKDGILWDTDSINMWILAEEACCFAKFWNITS